MRRKIFGIFLVAGLLALCGATGIAAAQSANNTSATETLDSIAAVVNKDIIMQSQVDNQVRILRSQLQQQHQSIPPTAELKKQVLNRLIDEKLLLQQAKAQGISVSQANVDAAIKNIAQENHMTVAQLQDAVEKQGLSFHDYQQHIRDQILIAQAQQQTLAHKITVTPAEIHQAMTDLSQPVRQAPEYHLQALLVPFSAAPTSAEIHVAEQKADAIAAEAKAGRQFADIAAQQSAAGQEVQGGDMGWQQLTQLPPAVAAQISSAYEGQIVGPIQTSEGFYILRIAGIKSGDADKQAKGKLSETQARELVYQRKLAQATDEWLKQLRAHAYIKISE